jgi:D-alanine transaminase
MSRIAYVNGAYVPQRDASVNVEDRGYQFADGIYEVVHVYRRRFIDEARHLDRLERSLREIALPMPMPRASLVKVLHEVVRRNRIDEGLLYMQVTRGVARRDHAFPSKPIPPALVVTVKRTPPYPSRIDTWGASAITHPDLRWARRDIKSTALLPNVLARQAAKEKGAIEAILHEPDGTITEGAATSFWIVDKAGVLRTRQLGEQILPGCTRGALMALMAEADVTFQEGPFTLEDARTANEAFITSATSFVKPILKLDGREVGDGAPGPVTRKLFDLFALHVKGVRNAA